MTSHRDTYDWELDRAHAAFRCAFPAYDATAHLDDLRTRDFARLDHQRHVYLDYTGAGLAPESELRAHLELLSGAVLGNPHSNNLTSRAATALVERARARVLSFFGASPDEYEVIFTPNATGALKLVGEAYPFAPGSSYALTADNHNSVNGIRELARARGAAVSYVPVVAPELRADGRALAAVLGGARPGAHNLFAYPAQSNFSGVQHPLVWIARAQAAGWDVLLDAASFVPTNRLDLGRWRPDFVDVSFYKMLGYPTGVGCLLARKRALAKMRRPWFAGGTIAFSTVGTREHVPAPGAAAFEDGTVNFQALPAVESGLGYLEAAGIDAVHARVMCLAGWLLAELRALRHGGGAPVVRLYGPAGTEGRGGTIALNVVDPDGRLWDCQAVERLASERRISLRAGCHCNPGAREAALGLSEPQLRARNGAGAVRISLGLPTTFADVHALARFVEGFADRNCRPENRATI